LYLYFNKTTKSFFRILIDQYRTFNKFNKLDDNATMNAYLTLADEDP